MRFSVKVFASWRSWSEIDGAVMVMPVINHGKSYLDALKYANCN